MDAHQREGGGGEREAERVDGQAPAPADRGDQYAAERGTAPVTTAPLPAMRESARAARRDSVGTVWGSRAWAAG
ncbi:hypothetical protein OIE43_00995 [Streptomyces pseudovenezuelae]|uniref:hypothetical protein n=1 Tax=Streptomyces pseudovenezuelae TaxID=67350 RepID=UPI002E333DFE|nr:hypothetical protein [Streptomyces pseudovenezuelae]